MSGMFRTIRSLTRDPSVLKKTVKPGTAKRMLRFAAPCGWLLGLFLLVVIVDAGVGIINPLIYRNIINDGILRGDAALIVRLAVLAAILGVFDASLGLVRKTHTLDEVEG